MSMMCRESLTFCCCVLLLIVVSLISQSSSTSDDKKDQNSTVQCEFDENVKRNCDKEVELARNNFHKNAKHNKNVQYDFRMKSMRNDSDDDDSMQHKFSADFVNYFEKDNQINLRTNFTKADIINNGNNSTNHSVPYGMCDNITCIQLCCPLGNRLVDKDCIAGENEYFFPNVYDYSNDSSLQSKNKTVDELFQLIVQFPCQETKHFLDPNSNKYQYKYMFFTNGSLYLPYFNLFVESTSYCLAVVDHNQFDAIICLEIVNEAINKEIERAYNRIIEEILSIILSFGSRVVSMLCFLVVFLVYSILPELRNTHSFMLRRYSSLSFIAYLINIMNEIIDVSQIYFICVIRALIEYYIFLVSFFWLSVMSFDMWWTFREFRSFRRNAKQQKRRKLMYSIFAWGGPFILAIICAMLDFVPNVPENFRPGFGIYRNCWFHDAIPLLLYFYGLKSICIISSICLSIYTILKITCYEKDMTRHLRDSESRCYNDNKQWFTLYLKLYITLFIIMTIHWIISTAWEFSLELSFNYITILRIWYILSLLETIQNISIFIIFVCKKTVVRLLLRRFYQNRGSLSKTSTRSSYYFIKRHGSVSRQDKNSNSETIRVSIRESDS